MIEGNSIQHSCGIRNSDSSQQPDFKNSESRGHWREYSRNSCHGPRGIIDLRLCTVLDLTSHKCTSGKDQTFAEWCNYSSTKLMDTGIEKYLALKKVQFKMSDIWSKITGHTQRSTKIAPFFRKRRTINWSQLTTDADFRIWKKRILKVLRQYFTDSKS